MARRGAIDRLEEPVRATVDKLIHDGHTTVAIGEHLAGLGKPVSYAALGRYRRRLEAQMERYREAQAIAGAWVGVGLIGFPNALNEYLTIRNDAARGRIRFIVGGTERAYILNDGSVVVGAPTDLDQGEGTLNAEGLFVDGQPVLTEVAKSLTQNGYLRLSNGLIIQWGTLPGVLAAPTIGTFPIAFPNAALTITAVVKDGLNRNKPVDAFINSPSQFQFQINTSLGMNVGWIAIGH